MVVDGDLGLQGASSPNTVNKLIWLLDKMLILLISLVGDHQADI
jgi:hypothetical protein